MKVIGGSSRALAIPETLASIAKSYGVSHQTIGRL